MEFILKINKVLDLKVDCKDDACSYSLPSELFVGALQSNYLIEEQKKSLSNKTYSMAHSRKRKARKKYLEGRANKNTEQETSTVINSLALEKENKDNFAAEFDRVFGKQEYN